MDDKNVEESLGKHESENSPSSQDVTKKSKKPRIESVTPAYEVKLERVVGLTVPSNAALDCDPNTGLVAYPAGCTVVLLNERKNRQTHVQNASRKTITCVAFSTCGRYLATGECGHQPSVRVWDLSDKTQVSEFFGHTFGVSCVAFSPAQKYVVSVGSQHDMIVNVWDWRSGVKVASNKFSSKVKAISFAENGSYFVTAGNRHVKFWYLYVARGSKFKDPVPLTGRSAILGEQRNNYFCDVACGRGEMGNSTFAITKSGLLCEFNNRRLLDKWVELRTTSANCLVAGCEYIFVGCAEGIIRCFSPFNLQFVTTLPRTHYLGVDVSKGLTISHMGSHPNNAQYPDTTAISFDESSQKVMAVYNDHSLYVWDVRDIKRVGKSHSYLSHSACIWGIEMCPQVTPGDKSIFPDGSFITCSSDDTMRIWNIDGSSPTTSIYKRNIYSEDLLKIIYVDPDLTYVKDTDITPQGNDKNDGTYDSRNGVRCIKLNYDGKHLASGDRAGNIRIHDLEYMDELCKIEAHDAEVLCLEYSKPETGYKFLSSASRDRLIHVFNVDQEYNFVQTLDDHSSAITSVRFYQSQGNLQMVSCGADRSIIFRTAGMNAQNEVAFSRGHNVVGKSTLYDMEVDHGQRHILTACQDRNIRVYNVNSGKHSKTFKGSIGDDGTLIKVVLDQSGIYAATSCTDKNMCIYDYYSGECMATMYGHSELVTGIKFTNDGKHLITVSGDGCIFVWSLPRDMTQIMQARLAQQAERAVKEQRKALKAKSINNNEQPSSPVNTFQPPVENDPNPDYRFSVGQLPLWAKKQMNEGDARGKGNGTGTPDLPKGRWAQRLHNHPVTFKSHYDTDSVIPFPEKTEHSESSKESSLEDTIQKGALPQPPPRKYSNKQDDSDYLPPEHTIRDITMGSRYQMNSTPKKVTIKTGSPDPLLRHTDDSDVSSLRVDDGATDHDGDIEDYCEHDDESTGNESTRNLMYYPPNDDSAGSVDRIPCRDFTVNAMDVDELRRSQRRYRKSKPERPSDIPLVTGSQDSDDDDEVSTPSADTAERNIMSMLSMSSESVDRVGRRETFLKNTFESLEVERQPKELKNKNSISYKFQSRNRDVKISSEREALGKRIEETRRKLQSIGYKSTLRTSKSISDLSNIPEKDTTYTASNLQGNEALTYPYIIPFPSSYINYMIKYIPGNATKFKSSIGGALYDGTEVRKEFRSLGRQLLIQFETYLKEFENLSYRTYSPVPFRPPTTCDDESEIESEFSCDSLDDDSDDTSATLSARSDTIPERNVPMELCLDQFSTLPSRKKPNQADFLSKFGGSSCSTPDKPVFHVPLERTSSDSSYRPADTPTPTNPPFFSVRSPTSLCLQLGKISSTETLNLSPHGQSIYCLRTQSLCSHKSHSNIYDSSSYSSDFPIIRSQPQTPGFMGTVVPPGKAQRVWLSKRVPIEQLLPSKHGSSADSGFSSGTSAGGNLRRACSLSDLHSAIPKKVLPTPLPAGGKKSTPRGVKNAARSQSNLSRSSSIGMLTQSGDEVPKNPMRHTISSISKMTPRALKRKSNLAQAASTGDIRHLHEDSSSEDTAPSDHKNLRSRGLAGRNLGLPTRAVSERDLTRSHSLNSKNKDAFRGRFAGAQVPARRNLSDISRPSSAASTSPEELTNRIDFDSAPLTISLVESVCEWVVEGCERLSQIWWRTCSEENDESSSDEERHRALRSLVLGAAARATHALNPMTNPNAPPVPPYHTDSKDPHVVAMMQQYTDILVNMVQQKMAQQTPPGPS